MDMPVAVILFDFGGVVAEEGFVAGLREIAVKNGVPPGAFMETADRLIGESGYLTGDADESSYWQVLRSRCGITGSDAALRSEILSRFILRAPVLACVDALRARSFRVFLLTDQTNWLDEIERSTPFFDRFDGVYNSFRTRMSKRDERTFEKICAGLGVRPEEALFIDDNAGHVRRADTAGLHTILYTTFDDFSTRLRRLTGVTCTGPNHEA